MKITANCKNAALDYFDLHFTTQVWTSKGFFLHFFPLRSYDETNEGGDVSMSIMEAERVNIVEGDSDRWKELAKKVNLRRHELGLNQADIAKAGGPGTTRLHEIESAKRDQYRASLLHSLERVLGWNTGSIRAFIEDGEDISVPSLQLIPGTTSEADLQQQVNALSQRVVRLETQMNAIKETWLES